MDQYGPRIATATPKTLEKQREVMEAMRSLVAQHDEQLRRRRADIAALRHDLETLRRACGLLARTLPRMCRDQAMADVRAYFRKYSPDQPRVPAGNPDGGEWTSEGNTDPSAARTSPDDGGHEVSSSSSAGPSGDPTEEGPQYAALDTGTRTDAPAGGTEAQVAAGPGRPGYPINLTEDEEPGGAGHTIRDHVGKSEEYLLASVRQAAEDAQRNGFAQGLREGSFPSLEAANKLVNATVSHGFPLRPGTKHMRQMNAHSRTSVLPMEFMSLLCVIRLRPKGFRSSQRFRPIGDDNG